MKDRASASEPRRPLSVQSKLGVSFFNRDTEEFAEFIARDAPRKLLDVGTGTGYVAIRLALSGTEVYATDVSPRAKQLAERNAKIHGVDLSVQISDLFEDVEGTFDAIAFNPPFSPRPDRYPFAILKQLVRAIGPLERALMHRMPSKVEVFRRSLISRFVTQGTRHLSTRGALYLLLYRPEIPYLEGISTELEVTTYSATRLRARNLAFARLSRVPTLRCDSQV